MGRIKGVPLRVRRKNLGKRLPGILKLILAGMSVILLESVLIDRWVEPRLLTYACPQVENRLRQGLDQLIAGELLSEEKYRETLQIVSKEDGSLLALYTDTGLVNQLKAEITREISDRFLSKEIKVTIPLGNMWENSFAYGLGPDISLRIFLIGRVICSVESDYQAYGINQTRHLLTLRVRIEGEIRSSERTEPFSVESVYPIAEVILPGYVPDSYTQIYR